MQDRCQTRFTVSGSIIDYITDPAEGPPGEVSNQCYIMLQILYFSRAKVNQGPSEVHTVLKKKTHNTHKTPYILSIDYAYDAFY